MKTFKDYFPFALAPEHELFLLKRASRGKPYPTIKDSLELLRVASLVVLGRRIKVQELVVNKDHFNYEAKRCKKILGELR